MAATTAKVDFGYAIGCSPGFLAVLPMLADPAPNL
jgi:hypothetical protein